MRLCFDECGGEEGVEVEDACGVGQEESEDEYGSEGDAPSSEGSWLFGCCEGHKGKDDNG